MQPLYYCLYSLAAAESSQDGQDYSPNFFLIFHCHTPTTLTFEVNTMSTVELDSSPTLWRDMRGTHRLIYCASRAHLCDSTAFLYSIQTLNMESNSECAKTGCKSIQVGFCILTHLQPPKSDNFAEKKWQHCIINVLSKTRFSLRKTLKCSQSPDLEAILEWLCEVLCLHGLNNLLLSVLICSFFAYCIIFLYFCMFCMSF